MLRSLLLISIATTSLASVFAPMETSGLPSNSNFLLKQIAIQFICLLASLPLIVNLQNEFFTKHSANIGIENLFGLTAILLQAVLVTSSIIHFDTKQKNLVALDEYENTKLIMSDGWIVIDGVIGHNVASDINIQTNLSATNGIKIRSSGGLIDSAIQIASIVEENALPVHVQQYCESACVIIASASPYLSADRNAVFGFHRGAPLVDSSDSWSKFVASKATDQLISALRKNGIPEKILLVAIETSPDDMHQVLAQQLHTLGIVKRLTD